MTTLQFLEFLLFFSALTTLVIEGIKKIIRDKKNFPCNLMALIVSMIIGFVGMLIYYQLKEKRIDLNMIIYAVLMGFSSALVSMVGFDKVKQALTQLKGKGDD